jgi:hypothetical protein
MKRLVALMRASGEDTLPEDRTVRLAAIRVPEPKNSEPRCREVRVLMLAVRACG